MAANLKLAHVSSIPAFSSTIDTYAVSDHQALNARLLEEIAAIRRNNAGVQSSNRAGWHSERDFYEREEPGLRTLQTFTLAALAETARRYWPGFNPEKHRIFKEGWINVSGSGGFNTPHDHATCHLSGCYYVSQPQSADPDSGVIEFMSPISGFRPRLPFSERMLPTNAKGRPKEGHILIFPSYLRHWVYPNVEAKERVSIAFNMAILEAQLD